MPGRVFDRGSYEVLGTFLGGLSAPSNLYVALLSELPAEEADSDSIDSLEPPTGRGYSRVAYPTGASYWVDNGVGAWANLQQISFGTPSGDWGVMKAWCLCRGARGSGTKDLYLSGLLPESAYIRSGVAVAIAQGAIVLTLGSLDEALIL